MSKYDYLHALYQALILLSSDERNKIMREVEDKFREAEENGDNEMSVTNTLGSPREYAKQFLPIDDIKEINPDDISLDSLKSNEPIITEAPNLIAGLELASDPLDDDEALEEEDLNLEVTKEITNIIQPTHYTKQNTEIKKVYTSPQAYPKTQVANHPVKILILSFAMVLFNAIFVLGPFIATWSIIIALVASGFAIGISGLAVIFSGLLAFPLSIISVPIVMLSHPILLFAFGFLLTGIGGLLTVSMIYVIRLFGYITFKYFGWNLSVIRGY